MRFVDLLSRVVRHAPLHAVGLTALALALVVSLDRHAVAQTLFSGSFSFGTNNNVNSFAYNGTPILNLTVGNLTKNGVTSGSSSNNFRASNWALDASGTTGGLTGTVDLSKYFEFTLQLGRSPRATSQRSPNGSAAA